MLTFSQTTNFRLVQIERVFKLVQIERVSRRQFQFCWKWQKALQTGRKHCGKRRFCSLRAVSLFPHSVFKRHILQTRKNQRLFGKGLTFILLFANIDAENVKQDQPPRTCIQILFWTLCCSIFSPLPNDRILILYSIDTRFNTSTTDCF